jgi:hypothetical protein
MKKMHKILVAVAALVVILLLARYVIFADQFNKWNAGLQRVGEWQNTYRQQHPGATDAEVNAAFNAGIGNLTVWKEQYKQQHPGATDADADAAFNAAWKGH